MKAYIIMVWDHAEKHPTGEGFLTEEDAIAHCQDDEWLEHEEIDITAGALKDRLIWLLTTYDMARSESAAKIAMGNIMTTINKL